MYTELALERQKKVVFPAALRLVMARTMAGCWRAAELTSVVVKAAYERHGAQRVLELLAGDAAGVRIAEGLSPFCEHQKMS